MRACSLSFLTVLVSLFLTAAASAAPQLELTDPGLPLFEIRPLDRHVYVLTLVGKWNEPAAPDKEYFVNVFFPNGRSYSTRVDENIRAVDQIAPIVQDGTLVYRRVTNSPFRKGEVRVVLPEHQLRRNGVARRGTLTVVVSVGKEASAPTAPEVVSNALAVEWPMDRPVVRKPPRTPFSTPEPLDPFVLPGQQAPRRAPAPQPKKQ